MAGMSLTSRQDIKAIGKEVETRVAAVGKQVQMVVNYDNFYIAPDLTDDYRAIVRRLTRRYYSGVTRYTTSAFERLKAQSIPLQRHAPGCTPPHSRRDPAGQVGDPAVRHLPIT